MRFIGQIPSLVKSVLAKEIKEARKPIQVIGSGGFSIEQIATLNKKEVYSNDISLLSVAIGDYILDRDRDIELINNDFKILKEKMTNPLDRLSVVFTLYQASEFATLNNLTNYKKFNEIKTNQILYFKENKKIVKDLFENIKIKDMFVEDGTKVIKNTQDKIIFGFLPTYSGGYEKIYKFMDKSFSWVQPNYTLIDDEMYVDLNIEIISKGGLVFTDREIAELKDYKKIYIEETAGKPIYIYSSITNKSKYYKKHEKLESLKIPYFTNEEITNKSNIKFIELNQKNFNYYRNVFIGKDKVLTFGTGVGFCFAIDDKIVGFVSFKLSHDKKTIILLSDFTVAQDKYRRLSKLIIMLVRSKEVKDYLEKYFKKSVDSLDTIVFTKAPVSMKYRGEWKKKSRKEDRITYTVKIGEKTLKEELELWIKKHSTK